MKIKQFDWFILMINTKIERRKFKLKKMASRSKRFSLEHAIKFVTVSDDKEFCEVESSESESDSRKKTCNFCRKCDRLICKDCFWQYHTDSKLK